MQRFPDPVEAPPQTFEKREERQASLLRAAKWGIFARTCIIIMELAGVFWLGSRALKMDAFASIIDVASTLFLVVFIRLAERPPDKSHPFGHGRFEPLAGLLLGLMMMVFGFLSLLQHTSEFQRDETIHPFVWLIPFAALLLLEGCYQVVIQVARRENSPALAADAIHYRIDALTSLCAAAALLLASFFPEMGVMFDDAGAMAISGLMIILGIYAAKNNVYQILDCPPPASFFDRVRRAALRAKGVRDTEKLRIQLYGPDAHVDIDVEVDPEMRVDLAHEISQKVRAEIQRDWPAVRDVTVHIEPYYPNDH
jgi:cation diffusion facilitator family transporter